MALLIVITVFFRKFKSFLVFRFVSKGLGRELPEDWIQQVTAAEEFEAQVYSKLSKVLYHLNYGTRSRRD